MTYSKKLKQKVQSNMGFSLYKSIIDSKEIIIKDLENEIKVIKENNNFMFSVLQKISSRDSCDSCIYKINKIKEDFCKHPECVGNWTKFSSYNLNKQLAKEAVNKILKV